MVRNQPRVPSSVRLRHHLRPCTVRAVTLSNENALSRFRAPPHPHPPPSAPQRAAHGRPRAGVTMASAGIRKTPTGRYKVWWRLDDASQGSQTFDTRDQARDFKHDLLARLARGSWTCTTSPPTTVRTTRSCWPSRWPAMWPSTRPRPPRALGVTLDHRIGEAELEDLDLPAHVAELVRACWELGARPVLESCGCGSGRTCLASVATSRPRAAATRPPWGRCGGPGSPTPSAGPDGHTLPLDARGSAGGRAGRDRRRLVVLRRLGLSDDGGGVAGCLGGCSGSGSAADRQGGATYQNDRCMTSGRETTAKGGRLWRSCC